jgi:hypothetical protein
MLLLSSSSAVMAQRPDTSPVGAVRCIDRVVEVPRVPLPCACPVASWLTGLVALVLNCWLRGSSEEMYWSDRQQRNSVVHSIRVQPQDILLKKSRCADTSIMQTAETCWHSAYRGQGAQNIRSPIFNITPVSTHKKLATEDETIGLRCSHLQSWDNGHGLANPDENGPRSKTYTAKLGM